MPRITPTRPSPALVFAILALFVTLGGTAWAVARNSVDSQEVIDDSLKSVDLKDGASVTSSDIVDGSITGDDVDEATISGVASAQKANDALSMSDPGPISMPNSIAPIGILSIPHTGSYIVIATLEGTSSSALADGVCVLNAGGNSDSKHFELVNQTSPGLDRTRYEDVALQAAHSFVGAGSVTLACADNGSNIDAVNTRITAVQANHLQNPGF